MAANAGRKAAHPNLKLIAGRTAGTDSGGRKVPEPINLARGIPDKPDYLSDHAADMWDQVIKQLQTTGILKPMDTYALQMACESYAMWREALDFRQQHGILGKNSQGVVVAAYIRVETEAGKQFRAWCAEFGFTPAAEKNLGEAGGSGGGGDNPF